MPGAAPSSGAGGAGVTEQGLGELATAGTGAQLGGAPPQWSPPVERRPPALAAAPPAASPLASPAAARALSAAASPAGAAGPAALPSPGPARSPGAPLPCVPAEICIQITRACGLQAAVKEAQAWLGGGTTLLGSAAALGPHPYATFELLPPAGASAAAAAGAPAKLKTPFQVGAGGRRAALQRLCCRPATDLPVSAPHRLVLAPSTPPPPHPQAQTFVPQFNFRQVAPLTLTPATLAMLAESDARVEVWHRAPRSQAVATALASGRAASGAAGAQSVLLGAAACPLAQLLLRPQGVSGAWLVLKSRRGVAVGAVEVSVVFTSISGRPHDVRPGAPSPLERCVRGGAVASRRVLASAPGTPRRAPDDPPGSNAQRRGGGGGAGRAPPPRACFPTWLHP
jgi:hypothetical protein